mmetsp:Transcript_137/g.386  ORF Transcript_137/g.386 Transcript_137/m.386 type:complete len:345 (+) Transcript_137:849-1883(+)
MEGRDFRGEEVANAFDRLAGHADSAVPRSAHSVAADGAAAGDERVHRGSARRRRGGRVLLDAVRLRNGRLRRGQRLRRAAAFFSHGPGAGVVPGPVPLSRNRVLLRGRTAALRRLQRPTSQLDPHGALPRLRLRFDHRLIARHRALAPSASRCGPSPGLPRQAPAGRRAQRLGRRTEPDPARPRRSHTDLRNRHRRRRPPRRSRRRRRRPRQRRPRRPPTTQLRMIELLIVVLSLLLLFLCSRICLVFVVVLSFFLSPVRRLIRSGSDRPPTSSRSASVFLPALSSLLCTHTSLSFSVALDKACAPDGLSRTQTTRLLPASTHLLHVILPLPSRRAPPLSSLLD